MNKKYTLKKKITSTVLQIKLYNITQKTKKKFYKYRQFI